MAAFAGWAAANTSADDEEADFQLWDKGGSLEVVFAHDDNQKYEDISVVLDQDQENKSWGAVRQAIQKKLVSIPGLQDIRPDQLVLADENLKILDDPRHSQSRAIPFLESARLSNRLRAWTVNNAVPVFTRSQRGFEVKASYGLIPQANAEIDFAGALCELIENSMEATRLIWHGEKVVDIRIDRENREIVILDNGRGISKDVAYHNLTRFARSPHLPKYRTEGGQMAHLSAKFGKYGIGRLAAFMFGVNTVVVDYRTRPFGQAYVLHIRWDAERMKRRDQLMIDILEEGLEGLQPDERVHNHFTKLTIRNVADGFFDYWEREGKGVLKTLAEKYYFYLHGMAALPGAPLGDDQFKVRLSIDGQNLAQQESFLARLLTAAKPLVEEANPKIYNPDPIIINHAHGETHAKFVFYYFTANRGVESRPLRHVRASSGKTGFATETQLLTCWQELYLPRQEIYTSDRLRQLPWMRHEYHARKHKELCPGELAFQRVVGLLFVDASIAINSHKTEIVAEHESGLWDTLMHAHSDRSGLLVDSAHVKAQMDALVAGYFDFVSRCHQDDREGSFSGDGGVFTVDGKPARRWKKLLQRVLIERRSKVLIVSHHRRHVGQVQYFYTNGTDQAPTKGQVVVREPEFDEDTNFSTLEIEDVVIDSESEAAREYEEAVNDYRSRAPHHMQWDNPTTRLAYEEMYELSVSVYKADGERYQCLKEDKLTVEFEAAGEKVLSMNVSARGGGFRLGINNRADRMLPLGTYTVRMSFKYGTAPRCFRKNLETLTAELEIVPAAPDRLTIRLKEEDGRVRVGQQVTLFVEALTASQSQNNNAHLESFYTEGTFTVALRPRRPKGEAVQDEDEHTEELDEMLLEATNDCIVLATGGVYITVTIPEFKLDRRCKHHIWLSWVPKEEGGSLAPLACKTGAKVHLVSGAGSAVIVVTDPFGGEDVLRMKTYRFAVRLVDSCGNQYDVLEGEDRAQAAIGVTTKGLDTDSLHHADSTLTGVFRVTCGYGESVTATFTAPNVQPLTLEADVVQRKLLLSLPGNDPSPRVCMRVAQQDYTQHVALLLMDGKRRVKDKQVLKETVTYRIVDNEQDTRVMTTTLGEGIAPFQVWQKQTYLVECAGLTATLDVEISAGDPNGLHAELEQRTLAIGSCCTLLVAINDMNGMAIAPKDLLQRFPKLTLNMTIAAATSYPKLGLSSDAKESHPSKDLVLSAKHLAACLPGSSGLRLHVGGWYVAGDLSGRQCEGVTLTLSVSLDGTAPTLSPVTRQADVVPGQPAALSLLPPCVFPSKLENRQLFSLAWTVTDLSGNPCVLDTDGMALVVLGGDYELRGLPQQPLLFEQGVCRISGLSLWARRRMSGPGRVKLEAYSRSAPNVKVVHEVKMTPLAGPYALCCPKLEELRGPSGEIGTLELKQYLKLEAHVENETGKIVTDPPLLRITIGPWEHICAPQPQNDPKHAGRFLLGPSAPRERVLVNPGMFPATMGLLGFNSIMPWAFTVNRIGGTIRYLTCVHFNPPVFEDTPFSATARVRDDRQLNLTNMEPLAHMGLKIRLLVVLPKGDRLAKNYDFEYWGKSRTRRFTADKPMPLTELGSECEFTGLVTGRGDEEGSDRQYRLELSITKHDTAHDLTHTTPPFSILPQDDVRNKPVARPSKGPELDQKAVIDALTKESRAYQRNVELLQGRVDALRQLLLDEGMNRCDLNALVDPKRTPTSDTAIRPRKFSTPSESLQRLLADWEGPVSKRNELSKQGALGFVADMARVEDDVVAAAISTYLGRRLELFLVRKASHLGYFAQHYPGVSLVAEETIRGAPTKLKHDDEETAYTPDGGVRVQQLLVLTPKDESKGRRNALWRWLLKGLVLYLQAEGLQQLIASGQPAPHPVMALAAGTSTQTTVVFDLFEDGILGQVRGYTVQLAGACLEHIHEHSITKITELRGLASSIEENGRAVGRVRSQISDITSGKQDVKQNLDTLSSDILKPPRKASQGVDLKKTAKKTPSGGLKPPPALDLPITPELEPGSPAPTKADKHTEKSKRPKDDKHSHPAPRKARPVVHPSMRRLHAAPISPAVTEEGDGGAVGPAAKRLRPDDTPRSRSPSPRPTPGTDSLLRPRPPSPARQKPEGDDFAVGPAAKRLRPDDTPRSRSPSPRAKPSTESPRRPRPPSPARPNTGITLPWSIGDGIKILSMGHYVDDPQFTFMDTESRRIYPIPRGFVCDRVLGKTPFTCNVSVSGGAPKFCVENEDRTISVSADNLFDLATNVLSELKVPTNDMKDSQLLRSGARMFGWHKEKVQAQLLKMAPSTFSSHLQDTYKRKSKNILDGDSRKTSTAKRRYSSASIQGIKRKDEKNDRDKQPAKKKQALSPSREKDSHKSASTKPSMYAKPGESKHPDRPNK